MNTKRGLMIFLVIAALAVISGIVWILSTRQPQNAQGSPTASLTATAASLSRDCTNSISYWMKHPELYPPQVVIGEQVYGSKDIGAILTGEAQDVPVQLQGQLLVAFLNFLAGAEERPVEATIFEAYGWLVAHPPGSQVAESARSAGVKLYDELEAYNEGLAGAIPCEGTQTPTMIMTATLIRTPTYTITTSSTATRTTTPISRTTPTPTSTQTVTPTITRTPTPTRRIFVPTRTSTRTREEPGVTPTRIPSYTPPPTPTSTSTPIPPTYTPSPSDTPIPQPSPTPTTQEPTWTLPVPTTEPPTVTLPPPTLMGRNSEVYPPLILAYWKPAKG